MSKPVEVNDTIICNYCHEPAKLLAGDELYGGRRDLAHKFFYRCEACDAHVGCHPRSIIPLGGLAKGSLRKARARAHKSFDKYWWKKPAAVRRECYARLAELMRMHVDDCHIGEFDKEQCLQVIEICRRGLFTDQ